MSHEALLWSNARARRRHRGDDIVLVLDNNFVGLDDKLDAAWLSASTPCTQAVLAERVAARLECDAAYASAVTDIAVSALLSAGLLQVVPPAYLEGAAAELWSSD